MKTKMDENLRGEMTSPSKKVQCPTINLKWLLNPSNDESDEVRNFRKFFFF
jgi:hypothetical protein